jgi:tRNA modification GTPase
MTGEDVVEFQVSGGGATREAVLAAVLEEGGGAVRLAEPGEFLRRALSNGKASLLHVERLKDLLESETQAELAVVHSAPALRLRTKAEALLQLALRVAARLEAMLDFGDEEDVQTNAHESSTLIMLRELRAGLASVTDASHLLSDLRQGLPVVLTGAPNVGKSSLLNALSAREAALVHDRPGTTRDVLRVSLALGGVGTTLVDTAGVRDDHDATDPVERMGIARARQEAADATVRLHVVATDADAAAALAALARPVDLVVRNKVDVSPTALPPHPNLVACSAATGEGIDEVRAALAKQLQALVDTVVPDDGASAAVWRTRQADHVAAAVAASDLAAAQVGTDLLLAADTMRTVIGELQLLTGAQSNVGVDGRVAVDAERILDTLFADFCIGK